MGSQNRNILIIFTVFLLAVITQGVYGQYSHGRDHNDLNPYSYPGESAMWCFQCSSLVDKDCAYIQPNDTSSYHYKPCLDTEKYQGVRPFCRKLVQKIMVRDNMEVVVRRCGWVKHPRLDCYQMRNEDHEEISCQCFEMGCNGAPSPLQMGPLVLILTGVSWWMVKFTMPGLLKHLFGATLLVCFTQKFTNAEANRSVIHCYQCHSKYDDDCTHLPINSSIHYKPCEESEKYAGKIPFCRKISQKIHGWGGKQVTLRKCGWVRDEETCYRVRNWDHSETVCQCFSDGCNFGSVLHSCLGLLLLPLLVIQVSMA